MGKKKVIMISIIAILAIAIMLASYVLVIMPKKGEEITSEEIAKVEEGEKLQAGTVNTANWDTENRVNIVYAKKNVGSEETVAVPVPKGYVSSDIADEKIVNTGFVIYEGEEPVTDDNKEEAQKTRNQWVWVPVEDPSEIYGTDSNGIKHGKLYNFSDSGRSNCNWTESNGVMSITSSTSYYREPDVVTNYDCDLYTPNYLTEETRNSINKELKENFEMTIQSIEKYGGFYIGRYETGGLNGEAKVVRGDTNIEYQNWYTMYEKSKELRANNSNVRTSMIWGCQWDATLEWLVKSGSKTYSQVGYDSTSWGNYHNSTFSYANSSGGTSTKSSGRGTIIPTGSTEYTKANNIYDLAGNVQDWTLEASNTNSRVTRGGYCNDRRRLSSRRPLQLLSGQLWRHQWCKRFTLRSPVA